MNPGKTRSVERFERRLELLRALIELQAQWRHAFIGLNLPDAERCAAEEHALCAQIATIDAEIASLRAAPPGSVSDADAESDARIAAARRKIAAAQAELRFSNQGRQAILRRSVTTIGALRNLFNSYAATYAAPAAARTGSLYEERV